jgi:hypothetical protein
LRIHRTVLVFTCLAVILAVAAPALCWGNGGYSDNPANPDYGTHDWIAQHALDYLPPEEKQYITDNLAAYLYGTELPDRPASQGGIGDTTKHHVYYSTTGTLTDDAAAVRAQTQFDATLNYLKAHDYANASRAAGSMTHYIADLAVFCHVMGANTDWGAEDSSTHSNYETYVNGKTGGYNSTVFGGYLRFDGLLAFTSAFDATKALAYNSTFGDDGAYNCTWMNNNYGWSNQAFKDRCGESMNLAVNAVADVLHSLYIQLYPSLTTSPTPSPVPPTPTVTPTPAPPATPTPSPNPTATSTPTSKPTSTLTPPPKTTPKPLSTPTPSPHSTPTAPEFPAAALLIAAVLALTAIAMLYKKKPKRSL